MRRVLKAIGCVPAALMEPACAALYEVGVYQDSAATIRLFAIGDKRAQLLVPSQQQITWDEIIEFSIERFQQYRQEKSSVGQWAGDGLILKGLARPGNEFKIRERFGLRNVVA